MEHGVALRFPHFVAVQPERLLLLTQSFSLAERITMCVPTFLIFSFVSIGFTQLTDK